MTFAVNAGMEDRPSADHPPDWPANGVFHDMLSGNPVRMTMDQMKKAAAMGAKMECIWMSNLQGPASHLASQRHQNQNASNRSPQPT